MRQLEALTREAVALANGTPLGAAESEVSRQLQICNACRYCEGFCAVFPAMTRRLEFGKADVHYLANLCHNCGACLHACQYAPPHQFAVNVPQSMAKLRGQTYADYAWPSALGKLYARNGLSLSLALAISLVVFLWLASSTPLGTAQSFYAIFPHNLLVGIFGPTFLFAVLALAIGVRRFLRDLSPATSGKTIHGSAASEATRDALRLKYLDGGHGDGCHNANDAPTHSRRWAHHLTLYGFLLCFAATSIATVYHYAFGWIAPYEFPSLPKLLGAVGGVMLCIGTAWLFALKWQRDPLQGDATQNAMDYGFTALLFAVSASGLVLWLARGSSLMPALLCLHLGSVMALFATLPYSKFAHGVFRGAALLRYAVERRQPNPVSAGTD
jgi:citrate/tricarballylate utilization protein